MFTNARNIQISGNAQFNYHDHRNDVSAELLKEGMRLLLSRVVKGAMHNSGERFDGPTCHPETRIAIQDDILGWADELVKDMNEIVTWLYGPAGAGKSAIAQTIAEKLHARDQLTASFFFSRASGGEGRGAETDLIATLAYQLAQSIPATQPYIAATVQKHPLVLDLALQDQVHALIVAPLIAISETSSRDKKPRIIVIDGLDECRKEKDAQRRVVNALIWGLRQMPHHTHKLFITSRPEYHIVSIFNKCEALIIRKMELNNKWNPSDDIRTFLLAGFADIRRSHFYFQNYPANKTWPTREAVGILVWRSSGQFIYPSVVLKYIKSEENYNPVIRLETILSLENSRHRPYAELDALYHYIFSQTQDVESVLGILSLEQWFKHTIFVDAPPFATFLSETLGLEKRLIEFQLRPLSSLLTWSEEYGISYKHASLPDFLLDESRSGDFYINSLNVAVALVSRVVNYGTALKTLKTGIFLVSILPYYTKILPPNQKFYVWALLSNFDIVETVLCNQDAVINLDNHLKIVTYYINWIVEESKYALSYLSRPVAQIQTWIVNHLALMNANYFESPHIDPWPFFAMGHGTVNMRGVRTLEQDLEAVLVISGRPRSQEFNVEEPHRHQMLLMWFFMGALNWLDRSDLLGDYAMTAERYGVALQRAAYYLLKQPEPKLSGTPEGHPWDYNGVELLLTMVLADFFALSPEATDTYFLVALLYPVMLGVRKGDSRHISAHIQRAVKKFPFLTDPTSVLYLRASMKLQETLVNLKIKSHLHKVAERQKWTWLLEEKLPYSRLLETFRTIDNRIS